MNNVAVQTGSVHGRFQPPHLDHLHYIKMAKRKCGFLWIGITQHDIRQLESSTAAMHRSDPQNNILTYWERTEAISRMLISSGLNPAEFGFCPFPIECPDKLPDYVGKEVVCFTTIVDDWNNKKISILRDLGYKVEVLWEKDKKRHEGKQIRGKIKACDPSWRQHVHSAVAEYLDEIGAAQRIS